MTKRRPASRALAGLGVIAGLSAGALYTIRERRRISFKGKTVLISGASRGLGLELARLFAAEGANLVLLARDEKTLDQAAEELTRYPVDIATVACDVTDPVQVRDAIGWIFAQGREVDILVNNAGVIQVGPMEHMELHDYQHAMAVHFWGPLYLINSIVPHMKTRGQGRIVNIASIGGKVAVPHLLPYAASKFALVGLSEGMRTELIKDGIYVTTVCPGLMRTGSHLHARFKGQHAKEYALFAIANASSLLSTSSQAAAREIVEACRYGRAELTVTPQARLLRLASAVFPTLAAETLGWFNRVLPSPDKKMSPNQAKEGWQTRSFFSSSLLTRAADRAAARNNELVGQDSRAYDRMSNRSSATSPES